MTFCNNFVFHVTLALLLQTMIAYTQTSPQSHPVLDFVQAGFDDSNKEVIIRVLNKLELENLPEALYVKGILYLNGCFNEGKRNAREATIYFSKSAAQGYVPAISALADSYLDGDGAIENQEYAFKLYKQAADKGHGSAQFNLAVLYRDGVGVKKSIKKARFYFKLALKNPMIEDLHDEIIRLIDDLKKD